MSAFWVFVGGGTGSLARYLLGLWLNTGRGFFWGTWLANALACFVLGLLIGQAGKPWLGADARLLLATGFCGGFSTFSTFSAEVVQLLRQGQYLLAGVYVLASLVAGLAAVVLGAGAK